MEQATSAQAAAKGSVCGRFPVSGLLALAATGFLTMLTETIPAGLLPQIGAGLAESPARAGQLLSIYAAGSVVAAIPFTALTRGVPRRRLLLITIVTVAAVNLLTAISSVFAVTMAGRLLAGMAAGIQWAMIAGYAMRLVDERVKGRALAISMSGIPLALAFGVPLGTLSATMVGWRTIFTAVAVLSVAAAGWVLAAVPEVPGEPARDRVPLARVLRRPGLAAVLLAAVAFELGHMTVFTYVAPVLSRAGLGHQVGAVLLVFGVAAIAGLWVTGLLIDGHLRALAIASMALFAFVMATLALVGTAPGIVVIAVAVWGFTLGGAPTVFQAASAGAARESVTVAQSMLVTVLNAGMAAGALTGGIALSSLGISALPWVGVVIFFGALVVVSGARRHAFPPPARRDTLDILDATPTRTGD
ncbi:MAG: MFS transporter [Geodermatophilaceae bacterium]|nr:MFS transporter [Geodermatophilaceae bacterium]